MNIKHLAAVALLAASSVACGGGAATTASPTAPRSAAATASARTASSAPSSAGSSDAAATGTPITVKDFTLDPIDVTTTGTVTLAVTNAGPTIHNIAIREDGDAVVATTRDLKTGEAETLTAELPAGAYVLFCSLPGHESLGIKGTLTVSP